MRRKYKNSLNKDDSSKTDQKKVETLKAIQHAIKHTLNESKEISQKEPKYNLITAHQRNTISYKEKEETNFRRFRYIKKDENNKEKTYNIISYNNRIEKNKNNNININNRENKIEINKSVNLSKESINYRFKKRKMICDENATSGQKIDKKRTCFYNRRTENKINNEHNITDINNVTATKQEKGKEEKINNKLRHRYRYLALSNNLDIENKDNKDNKEFKTHKFIRVNKEIKNNKKDRDNNYNKEGKNKINLLEEKYKMKTIESSKRYSLINVNNNKNKINEKNKETNKDENKNESNKIFTLIKKCKRRAPYSSLNDDKISNMPTENNNNTIDLIHRKNDNETEKDNENEKKVYCATEKNDYSEIKSTSKSNSQNKNKSTFNFLIHQAHENSNLSNTFNRIYESYKIHKKIKYDELTRKKTYNCLTSDDNDNSEKYPSHLSINSSSFNSISFLIKEYGSDKGKKNEFKYPNNGRSQRKINIREKLKNFLEISPKSEEIINDNVDNLKKLDSLSNNESINVTNKIVNNNTFNTTYNIYKINEPIEKKEIYCKPKQKLFRFSELNKERPINQSMQKLKYYNMITSKYESKASDKNDIYDSNSNSHKRIDSFLNKTPKKYQEIIINFNKNENNNCINFEHIYMLETKTKSILNKINNYGICFNECHDWIEYYFNKNIYDIIINSFKIKRNKNNIINKIKIETLCYFLCYDASFSKNFSQAGILIKTIFNLLHSNFLLLIGFIINNFTSKNNNNDPYSNHLINNLNNLINKELKINLSSQDMNNENCIIDIIEQNYKQINNYYKMIIDNIYNYNFTPSMSSSPVNAINDMNNNKMYKFPHCLSLNLDKLTNNQKLKIISLFFFDAYKLLNNYNILDLKIFYDLYLNKKTINYNSTKYNGIIRQNINNQKYKNKIGYHYILGNNFSLENDSKYLLSPIKSYYKYTLMINLDTIVYTDEIMSYHNTNLDKTKKKIILRPGLIKFLQEMKQIYELILFCNNSLEYIKKVLRHFETNENFFEHILCDNQLYFDKDETIKDLDLLGRNLKHIIIVDNNQNMFKSYKDNVVYIRPFYGNVSDDGNVLKELTEILKVIKYDIEDVDDVRISLYNHKLEIFTKISNYLF